MKTTLEQLKDKLLKRRNTLKITKENTPDVNVKINLGAKIRELATIIEMTNSMIRKEQKNNKIDIDFYCSDCGATTRESCQCDENHFEEPIDFGESDYDINPDIGDQ